MTDDIVTRLRKKGADERNSYGMLVDRYDDFLDDAADEIERLREWKELAYQMRNKYWWVLSRKILKKFDAMHKKDWNLPHNVDLRADLQKHWGK